MFTNALSTMSPAGFAITPTELEASVDRSFYSQSTPSGPTGSPSWCGPSTGRSYFISCHYHTLFIISSTQSCWCHKRKKMPSITQCILLIYKLISGVLMCSLQLLFTLPLLKRLEIILLSHITLTPASVCL